MKKTITGLVALIVLVSVFNQPIEAVLGVSAFLIVGLLAVIAAASLWLRGFLAELSTPDERVFLRRP